MYSSCVYILGGLPFLNISHLKCTRVSFSVLCTRVRCLLLCHSHSRLCRLLNLFFCLECFQNKFYIESKLNRDLREDLMKLFADHVAEKHVNTLMRECIASCGALMAFVSIENCPSACVCEPKTKVVTYT